MTFCQLSLLVKNKESWKLMALSLLETKCYLMS